MTSSQKISARDKILAAARPLFALNGYEHTSTETVLERSGVSRGALYHHFTNKQALFEAVLEALEEELAAAALEASATAADPIQGLRAAFASFLAAASTPEVRQIILIDAHSVLGWQKWREIEARYGFGLLKEGLRRAAHAGQLGPETLSPETLDLYAHMLLASLIEVAFLIARSPDPARETEQGTAALSRLIDRLLA